MTYCVGINIDAGLVLLSDTRTNAGVDNVARFKKMFTWEVPGERVVVLMVAGNLSITQGVLTRINTDIEQAAKGEEVETILNCKSLYRATEMVGDYMRELQEQHHEAMANQGISAGASMILAGQRKGGKQRLFMIYAAGNFIESTRDTPFFQIGEHKYGKPILDRVIKSDTSMEDAVKAVLVSMDSTLRSNLSVGMPLDLSTMLKDRYRIDSAYRIEPGDQNFARLSSAWSDALRHAFIELPEFHI